ncbi:MAG: AEC family transporter [Clostridia bacterium]|nr:AEC family transporter [Clostridia bacterium]
MQVNIGTVISKVIQLLLILLIGVYSRKRGFVSRETVTSLSKFLSNVTNPLLIICSFQTPYSAGLLKTGLLLILSAAIIHVGSAFISYFVFKPKRGSCENVVYEFNTVFANCAFMGFPILMAIYGAKDGVVLGSFYNTVFNVFFWTYGIWILTRHKRENGEGGGVDVKKLFLNPGVIATVIGFVFFIAGIKIPQALLGGMEMVGDSTFPLAMIIIGSLIVELDFKTAFKDVKFYICALIKLIVVPVITLFVCKACGAPSVVTYVSVVLAGMPSATFGAIFAELYGTNPVTSSKIVCLTTVLSIATIPLLLYITKLVIG